MRSSTRENRLSEAELESLGITPASVREMMGTTHRGWVCEVGSRVVGFAMGDRSTGEMWVVAVLPCCEGMGIGRRLMREVERWLGSGGHRMAWLTTDTDRSLRAYGFYRALGWEEWKTEDGLLYMRKDVGG